MTKQTQPDGTSGPDAKRDAALPHDRDETPTASVDNAQHRANRAPIDQARRDVESGVQDTERIGTPNDVPSSGRNAGKSA